MLNQYKLPNAIDHIPYISPEHPSTSPPQQAIRSFGQLLSPIFLSLHSTTITLSLRFNLLRQQEGARRACFLRARRALLACKIYHLSCRAFKLHRHPLPLYLHSILKGVASPARWLSYLRSHLKSEDNSRPIAKPPNESRLRS